MVSIDPAKLGPNEPQDPAERMKKSPRRVSRGKWEEGTEEECLRGKEEADWKTVSRWKLEEMEPPSGQGGVRTIGGRP